MLPGVRQIILLVTLSAVTLQIIWRSFLHAIWRILRVWTNWRGLRERPENAPLIDSTCSNLTWKMTVR